MSKPSDRNTQAQAILEKILEKDSGVGVVAAVYKNGVLVWSGASGNADIEAGVKMRTNHRMRIGSVSKTITAILALRLSEKGVFNLNTPISEYISGFPKEITPKLLGSHTSGIRQYDFSNLLEANNVFYYPNLESGLKTFKKDALVATPGAKFVYSGLGFNLMGAAIEAVTKSSFDEILSKEIAKHLDLKNTRVDNSLEIIKDRARFYTIGNPNPRFPWMKKGQVINTFFRDSSDYYPSGGLLSNAEDLAKFTDRIFNSDFLNPKSKMILKTPARLTDGTEASELVFGKKAAYSFGMRLQRSKGDSLISYGHGGATNGAYAIIRYFPKSKIALAAVTNYNVVAKRPSFFKLISEELPKIFESK